MKSAYIKFIEHAVTKAMEEEPALWANGGLHITTGSGTVVEVRRSYINIGHGGHESEKVGLELALFSDNFRALVHETVLVAQLGIAAGLLDEGEFASCCRELA